MAWYGEAGQETLMQQSRGGMGNKKHGTSGVPPKSPRFKHLTKLEAEGALGREKKKDAGKKQSAQSGEASAR